MGNKLTKKITSVLLSATTAVWLSGSAMLLPIANAQSADLQAQINALLSQITALQAQLASQGGAVVTACSFTRDLTVGAKGDDVKCLQQYLNGKGYKIAASGAGSPGNETTTFGSLTKAAAAKWQAASGISPAVGYFGSISRAKYTSLAGAAPVVTTPSTPVVAGVASGLTVSLAPNQPASGLFGESFASKDFTKVNFTASADGDVTVKALTVQRTGQGNDSAFSGVVLLDESGVRLGDAKTFGSTHTARLPDKFIVKAGQTRVITLAGDSDADQNDYNGQLVSLTLTQVEVEGGTNVNATYPMTGSLMTVNSTLAIGSATLARGPLDPGTGATKEIGTQGYIFSSLQITAGTNEDITVKSIKWNQSGSAATSDLTDIKVIFDGVTYNTEVSADGKYYTAKFADGIVITKGNNKEAYLKGNIVSGSNRTADFDLYRYAELQVVGNTYGYTLLPSASETGAASDDGLFYATNPRFDAFQVQIGNGSITAEKATTVSAQNVSENLSNQSLGGILVDVKGEAITVASMNFDVAITKAASGVTLNTDDLTSVSLVDKTTGKVVAGPVDGVAGYNNAIRFNDTVTFPVGRTVYELMGKYGTDFSQNDQIAASTTPSSDWSTVRGVESGQTITPSPASAVTLSTMTLKAGALTLTISSDTASSSPNQNVVAGTSAYPFAKYVLDASGSGEDLRITSMQLDLKTSYPANTADELTNCQLFDGSTPLNTGTNVVNPTNSDAAGADKTFSFNDGLIIPKGTVKTLTLKCNLIAGGTAEFAGWGLGNLTTAANAAVVTGMTSGTSVAETTTTDNGRTVIPQSAGTLSLALDSASPSLKLVQAGATDQVLAVLRLNALYEDIQLNEIGLQIATSTADAAIQANASNSPSDLTKVTLWDGATKVGETVFTNDYATATLSNFIIGKDSQKLLTVKADIAPMDVTLSQAVPGHLIIVNYDRAWGDSAVAGTEGAQGSKSRGLSSGSTIYTAGSDTNSNGARIVKAIPTLEKMTTSGKFTNTSDQTLYKFKVSAPAGTNGIGLYKFVFNVSTNTTSVTEISGGGVVPSHTFKVTNFRVFCYSDSGFNNGSCGSASGQLNLGGLLIADGAAATRDFDASGGDGTNTTSDPDVDVPVLFNPAVGSGATAEAIRIPAGETRWFALVADVTGASSTPSIATKLLGDPVWQGTSCRVDADSTTQAGNSVVSACDYRNTDANSGAAAFTGTAGLIDLDGGQEENFIWSDNATNTSQAIGAWDWLNGYLIPGLPTSATASEVVTF